METTNRAIVTVVGKDTIGIIAGVANVLSDNQINILDISQTVISGYFNMIMLVDIALMNVGFDKVTDALNDLGAKKGVEIRIQRTEIFDAMHEI